MFACCGMICSGNVGYLPLVIVPAICEESNGAFGDVEVCKRNGMAYVSLSMAVWYLNLSTFGNH